ncbi:MAG: hypothetical protein AAGB32_02345 [Pseudomonadota bacterium]
MTNKQYDKESGNVLFLILIAVALFAALSYAVTQSTRSGGGSADRETSLLNSASLTQYPASLRTSLIRMILNGAAATELEFNPPADFGTLSLDSLGVFHPNGGGGVYQRAPAEVMQGSTQGTWHFNGEWTIPDIGLNDAGPGNDIIAFLPGVSLSVCESINDRVGIDTTGCNPAGAAVPTLRSASNEALVTSDMDDSYTFPSSGTTEVLQGDGASCEAFTGQPTGCFNDATNGNVVYSVLLER